MKPTLYTFDPETDLPIGLGRDFAPYLERIRPLPAAYIELVEPEELSPWSSKVGGLPYLPRGFQYPQGSDGQELGLLAQINFDEVGPIEGFPQAGLLQIYVDPDGEMYGFDDVEDPFGQRDYRLVFHETVIRDAAVLDEPPASVVDIDGECLPVDGELGMRFVRTLDLPPPELVTPPSPTGKRSLFLGVEDVPTSNRLKEAYRAFAHATNYTKVGGYPCFFNGHPGERDAKLYSYDRLLFQLQSQPRVDFGGGGTANFLIKAEDLARRDFGDVLYTIDQ